MLATLKVVTSEEYEKWLNDKSAEAMPPVERGKLLYTQKACVACHSIDGTPRVGPSWLGLWGKDEKMTDGLVVHVDENYIRESILKPNAKIVAGFLPNLMPAFEGQISDSEVSALIAYIKSLGTAKE